MVIKNMASEETTRRMVWGFAITLLLLGILALLGGLMTIPTAGITQGVVVFLIVGIGGIGLGYRLINGLRLAQKHNILIS